MDGKLLQPLGYAFNLKAKLRYNEISEITFDPPAYIEGRQTPGYVDVVGMRVVELQGYGQFILVNPQTSSTGIREVKSCKAYSLEFEFTYKKLSIPKDTYNFWNPVTPDSTVLGIIMEKMPSWSVGRI